MNRLLHALKHALVSSSFHSQNRILFCDTEHISWHEKTLRGRIWDFVWENHICIGAWLPATSATFIVVRIPGYKEKGSLFHRCGNECLVDRLDGK